MYNKNAAYDFGFVEERRHKRGEIVTLPRRKSKIKERLNTRRKVLVGAFSAFLTVSLGFSTFIMGQAKLTEVTDQVEKTSNELKHWQSTNMQLSMKLESIKSSAVMDEIKSPNASQTEIVKIPKEVLAESH